jgi:hypothetical protein
LRQLLEELEEEYLKTGALAAPLSFWWRDDDAIADSDALQRLFGVASARGASVAVAVIPKFADDSLARAIGSSGVSCAWQHGWSHAAHGGNREFGSNRHIDELMIDAESGRGRMSALFGPGGWQPVFVPPWNHISQEFKAVLPGLGYTGLSAAFAPNPPPGLSEVNVDIDLIDWSHYPEVSFVGLDDCLRQLLDALRSRRDSGSLDRPIGIMTHHLVHNQGIWEGLDRFLDFISHDLGGVFCDSRLLFAAESNRRHALAERGGDA